MSAQAMVHIWDSPIPRTYVSIGDIDDRHIIQYIKYIIIINKRQCGKLV